MISKIPNPPTANRGSQRWLHILVNYRPDILNSAIGQRLPETPGAIDWRSPLASENYKEHKDREFLVKLGNSPYLHDTLPAWRNLYDFWPKNGPRWDAHGITNKGQILIIEAKSHTKEMQGAGSGAKDPESIEKIARSLKETQQFLGCVRAVDWAKSTYFQYANRLAHLYWFYELYSKDAYLVLLCFLNDTKMEARNTIVPKNSAEWKSAMAAQDRDMGIPECHPLSDRIIHVFIDVNIIKEKQ